MSPSRSVRSNALIGVGTSVCWRARRGNEAICVRLILGWNEYGVGSDIPGKRSETLVTFREGFKRLHHPRQLSFPPYNRLLKFCTFTYRALLILFYFLLLSGKMSSATTTSTYEAVRSAYSYYAKNEASPALRARIAAAMGYDPLDLESIPDTANIGASCGNPLAIANLSEVSR